VAGAEMTRRRIETWTLTPGRPCARVLGYVDTARQPGESDWAALKREYMASKGEGGEPTSCSR